MASKPLQLIVYHSPLFAAHWALFLPSPNNPKLGKRIHADGSPSTGFEVIIEPDYDFRECTQSYQIIDLGEVNEEDVERVAGTVAAPEKSLVPVSTNGPRRRIEMKNCQTWVQEVVAKLVDEGVIGEGTLKVVQNSPKN